MNPKPEPKQKVPQPACCNRNGCLVTELKKLVLWCDWRISLLAFVLLHMFIDYAAKKCLICAVILLALAVITINGIYCLLYDGDPIEKYPSMKLFICSEWSDAVVKSLNKFLANMQLIASRNPHPFEVFKWANVFLGIFYLGSLFAGATLAKCGLFLLFGVPPIYVWMQQLKLLKKLGTFGKTVGDLETSDEIIKQQIIKWMDFGEADNEAKDPHVIEGFTEELNIQEIFEPNVDQESLGLNNTFVLDDTLAAFNTFELDDTLEIEETFVLDDTLESIELNETEQSFVLNETLDAVKPNNTDKSFDPMDTKE